MVSPFPGMDPYIESQQRYHTFHTAFIAACADAINERLPPPLFATVEERVLIDVTDPDDPHARTVMHDVEPDVAVVSGDGPVGTVVGRMPVATLEPYTVPQAIVTVDRPTQKFVAVYGLGDQRLVTTVELMSRSNKRPGADRDAFLIKRQDLLRHGVNVVDLDLLIAGRRVPLAGPVRPAHYYAMVTRAESAERCEVYGWSVRDPLPTVPIPLGSDVAEVPLDLAAVFEGVYRRGHFGRQLNYSRPLSNAWPEAERAWAADRVAAGTGSGPGNRQSP